MSDFYRYRLRGKELLVGLSETEYDDLYHPKKNVHVIKNVRDAEYIPTDIRQTKEGDYALNRPAERHVLEAQRRQQQQEEEMLKELDKHREYAKDFMLETPKESKKKWWFF